MNHTNRIRVFIGLAAMVVASTPAVLAQSQTIQLRPALPLDRTLTYTLTSTLDLEQTPPGRDPVITHTSLDMTFKLTVAAARADGSVELTMQIERLKADSAGFGTPWSFEFPQADAAPAADAPPAAAAPDAPVAPGEPAADDDAKPHQIVQTDPEHKEQAPDPEQAKSATPQGVITLLTGSRARLMIDREGKLRRIDGIDNFERALAHADPDPALFMFSPAVLAAAITPILQPAAPEPTLRTFKSGDAWTNLRKVDLGASGSIDVVENWTMGPISGESAGGRADCTAASHPPDASGKVAPKIAITEQSGAATFSWNVADSALTSHSRTLKLATAWTLGDITMQVKQDSKTELKRVP